jgi:hypothetical protein
VSIGIIVLEILTVLCKLQLIKIRDFITQVIILRAERKPTED